MEIKLVIWDLDETLWSGTLAEGDDLKLNQDFAETIRLLNERGVVSSICSKNEADKAKAALVEMGLWEQFVFPHIRFEPKGEMISSMIEQMQLRPVNVLFIDDNVINLQEAKAREPELNILDARDPAAIDVLRQIVQKYEGVRKSRIDKYRALEARHTDAGKNTGSREDFLASCQIGLTIATRTDNIDFIERIEELINRTNQMNFTKSRVEPGTLRPEVMGGADAFSVFVWDKYGYHGLVGFALVDKKRTLRHFLFSCRIMHMGVEELLLKHLVSLFPELTYEGIPVAPAPSPWIKVERFQDREVRDKVFAAEKKKDLQVVTVRVMANCQSAALAHYAGILDVADFDNWPRLFSLQRFALGTLNKHQTKTPESAVTDLPPSLIYGAFSEYENPAWSADVVPELEKGLYARCVEKFCMMLKDTNRRMLVILPPEGAEFTDNIPASGVTQARLKSFNQVWENIEKRFANITLVRVSTDPNKADVVATSRDIRDALHFRPSLLSDLGARIKTWLESGASGDAGLATALPAAE